MKENIVHILEIFKGQIQCQNARIEVIDSSLININMLINEHLMYKNKMVSWLMLSWCWSLKIICISFSIVPINF